MARRRPRSRPAASQRSTPSPSLLGGLVDHATRLVGLPGLVSLALAFGFAHWITHPGASDQLAGWSPELVLAPVVGLGLLALLLRQGRTLWLDLAALGLYLVGEPRDDLLIATALAVALIGLLAPRHPLRRRNLTLMAVVALALWATNLPAASPLRQRAAELFATLPGDPTRQAFALAALVLVVRLLRRPSPLPTGALWGLLLLYVGWIDPGVDPTARPFVVGGVTMVWIVASLAEAHALSFRDALTRLPGRRAFDRELSELGRRYAIAIVDIDHFKRVNDRHGHDVGDQVLAKVAGHLARVPGARAFRYGGEEFALVFRGGRAENYEERLDALRERIAGTPFGVRGSKQRLKVSVSIGGAQKGPRHPTAEEVLVAADKALYRAKRAGRNRVKTS